MTDTFHPRLLVPSVVTAANLATGFFALLAAAEERYEQAVYFLMAALLLDMLDGRLARLLGATSKFGKELDSFSDALSFSAAPAFLVERAVLAPLGPLGSAIAVFYLLAGVYRLVRYNLTSEVHSKARRTLGVPTPIGAGYLMVLVLMRAEIPTWIAAAVVCLFALLLASRLPLPQVGQGWWLGVSLLVGLINFLAVVIHPSWGTIIWWNVWNVVILLSGRRDSRRHREAVDSPSVG